MSLGNIIKYVSKFKGTKYFDYSIVTLFFVGILLFLFLTGTLNSGYHFIDDHEMLKIHSDLESNSFIDVSTEWIGNDFNIRFRPIYFLHRVLEIKLLGINFFILSFYTGILAALTFSLFYIGARKLNLSVFLSLIFIFLTFIGSQMAIWWRLGPNETIGMVFLGFSFYFMTKCIKKKRYLLNTILFIIFLILASLSKESFVIIIPAFVLFKIWNEKNTFNIPMKKSIENNLLLALPMIIMLFELWFIKYVVGTDKIGYAGTGLSVYGYLKGIKNIILNKNSLLGWLILLLILIVIHGMSFLFIKNERKKKFIQSIKYLLLYLSFSIMIVLPNIFLYSKSGMAERYLLPSILGLSVLAIIIVKNTKKIFCRRLVYLVIFIFITLSFWTVKVEATNFAKEGKETNELLSTVTKNTKSDSKILFVFDPLEKSEVISSSITYLTIEGVNNLYGYLIEREYTKEYERRLEKKWKNKFKDKTIENMNGKPDIILVLNKNQSEVFFSQSGTLESEYINIITNNSLHAVYLKK